MIPLVLCFFAPFAYDQYTLPKIWIAALAVAAAGLAAGFQVKPLTRPLLLMFAAVCLSAALSGDLAVNLMGRYCARYLAVLPLGVCLLAYHLPLKKPDVQLRWAGGLLAGYGLLQLVWNPLCYPVLASGHRVIGVMGSPPALGCALAMCFPFCLGRSPARALLTALVMAGIIATGSRGALLAAAVASLLLVPGNPGYSASRSAAWALGAAFALLCLVGHGVSDQIRWMTWADSVRMWWAHPIFGVGAESYVDYWRVFHDAAWIKLVGPLTFQDHAHNDILEALAAFGVVGLAAYGNLLWRVVKSDLDRASLAALVAVFICAKFNAVPFAVIFSLAVILGARERGRAAGGWAVSGGVALALFTLFSSLFFADVIFYHARRVLDYPGIEIAANLNPYELFYRAQEADLLTRKWGDTRETDLLSRALLISEDSVTRHPISVQAQHMLTQTLLFLAQRDPKYLARAHAAAERLVALDPQLNYRFKIVVKK